MCALNKNPVLCDRVDYLITLILGWVNLAIFIVTILNYYKHFIHTSIYILPVAVINISGTVALMLLIFCLLALRRTGGLRWVFMSAAPSLLVFLSTLLFAYEQGGRWLVYFV